MSKDNIITKFRDAMGLMANYASPIGGYISSKVRQGLNKDVFKPMEDKFRKDREQRQSWRKNTDEELERILGNVFKEAQNAYKEHQSKMNTAADYLSKSPGIYDNYLYDSVVNPTPYPLRTMGDVYQSTFAPLHRLMAQEELRDTLRKSGYNPYVNRRDTIEESLNHYDHQKFSPWRVLRNLPQ